MVFTPSLIPSSTGSLRCPSTISFALRKKWDIVMPRPRAISGTYPWTAGVRFGRATGFPTTLRGPRATGSLMEVLSSTHTDGAGAAGHRRELRGGASHDAPVLGRREQEADEED